MSSDNFEDDYWNQSTQEAFKFDESDFVLDVSGGSPKSVAPSTNYTVAKIQPSEISVSRESIDRVLSTVKRSVRKEEDLPFSADRICTRIFHGDSFMVHHLKSKADKLLFLDGSISRGDGNFIIMAAVHLKNTCSTKLFNREICKRPIAMDHYIKYLKSKGNVNILIDFLTMCGRSDDAAVAKLKQCVSCVSIESKIRQLKHCNQNYFSITNYGSGQETSDHWAILSTQYVTLLEQQLPIEEDDKRQESMSTNELNAKFLQIPRRPLPNLPLITTLFYCCVYHYDLPENCLASPIAIRKMYHLSDKQFNMTALAALSLSKKWDQIDGLFKAKSWLGLKKTKIPLKPEIICQILAKFEAPPEVSNKYLMMIEDDEKREKHLKEQNLRSQ